MQKLDYIRRYPGIMDFNLMVDKINEIIDRLDKKIEIKEIVISREVKDFKFFNWDEVSLPYSATYTLSTVEDASKVFKLYALTYKEMNNISSVIEGGDMVSLVINVTEEITEKEKKQEAIFETVESIDLVEPVKVKKKRGRPKKKTSWK